LKVNGGKGLTKKSQQKIKNYFLSHNYSKWFIFIGWKSMFYLKSRNAKEKRGYKIAKNNIYIKRFVITFHMKILKKF